MSTWIYNGMELDERPTFDGENRYAMMQQGVYETEEV